MLVFGLALSCPAQEVHLFEVYPLGFIGPSTAEQAAETIVGGTGSVILDRPGSRLLVSTDAARHKQIEILLKKLNVPPKNVRIDVTFKGRSGSSESALGVSGKGDVLIKKGKTSSTIHLIPIVKSQSTTSSRQVTQSLLVMSGRKASLRVGERVPYLQWLTDYGLQWGYFARQVQWQEVGSSLQVEPTVIGEGPLIQVRITPELSGLVDGQPLRTRFERVATEVTVESGQSFSIGGSSSHKDFYSRFLFGSRKGGKEDVVDIWLTPQIIPLGQPTSGAVHSDKPLRHVNPR